MSHVLAIGDNCVDVYVHQGIGYPGGGPVNVAVYLARHGFKAAYAGAVGQDLAGQLMIDSLADEGVDLRGVQVLPGLTNLAFVAHQGNDRRFLGVRRGVRSQFRWNQLPPVLLEEASLVHTTVDGGVNDLMSRLRDTAQTSYDFSDKFTLAHLELMADLDLVFGSAAEMSFDDAKMRVSEWCRAGAGTAVLTRGDRGSMALSEAGLVTAPAHKATVVDTLGAGDAFIAGYLAGHLEQLDIEDCLEQGSRWATEAIGGWGGYGHGVSLSGLGLEEEVAQWR